MGTVTTFSSSWFISPESFMEKLLHCLGWFKLLHLVDVELELMNWLFNTSNEGCCHSAVWLSCVRLKQQPLHH